MALLSTSVVVTTGISILKDGRVVYTVDEPTGGTHMNLVISGAYGISIPEAEAYKRNEANKRDVYATIRPVVEKWQLFLSVRYKRVAMKRGLPLLLWVVPLILRSSQKLSVNIYRITRR